MSEKERVCVLERDERPWGWYEVYVDAPDHKLKRILVRPGARLSLQRHHRREEHWYVVAGSGVAWVDDRRIRVTPGVAVDIPRKSVHRMENDGDADLVFIEVQRGDYFGEDDIERLEDDYGRT